MNWERLLGLFIKHTSWPITILIIVVIFKEKIGKIINFKAKDYEISFQDEFKSIKKDIKAGLDNKNNSFPITEWKITSTESLKDNMLSLAERSPLAVVLQAWGIIEHNVIECAEIKGFKNLNNPSAAIYYLYENKYIDMTGLNIYFRLYALKEKYVNSKEGVLNKEGALETSDIILEFSDRIKKNVK